MLTTNNDYETSPTKSIFTRKYTLRNVKSSILLPSSRQAFSTPVSTQLFDQPRIVQQNGTLLFALAPHVQVFIVKGQVQIFNLEAISQAGIVLTNVPSEAT